MKVFITTIMIVELLFSCSNPKNNEDSSIDSIDWSEIESIENIPQIPKLPESIESLEKKSQEEIDSIKKSQLAFYKSLLNRCEGYLKDPDTTGTNIRKTPGGKIMFKIKNGYQDHPEPEYQIFNILGSHNNWLCVSGNWEQQKFKGYIHNTLVESTLKGGKLTLYKNRNLELKDEIMLEPASSKPVNLLSYEDGLVKVKFTLGLKKYEGWIKAYKICGSPYTTCN